MNRRPYIPSIISSRRLWRTLAVLAIAGTLASCSSAPKEESKADRPVSEIYNQAMDALERSEFAASAKLFDEVERQHPYSVWATKAQLMAGFAHYQAGHYDDVIIAVERFIQLHPGNRDVAYAYYLKAISYYEQITDVVRDQLITQKAMTGLQEILRRFPRSKYARDARLKLDLTRDHLAGKEMSIGRYYLRKGQYLAAINRFRRVIDNFQTTSHVPEALLRLAESYSALGIKSEAQKVTAVLGHNYPGSEWYEDGYGLVTGANVRKQEEEENKGFLRRTWEWIF
jgi:outer membrane protein assembly factor BamD